MATAIYSLSFVHGAERWLLFWLICVIAYIGVCFLVKPNRTRRGIQTVLIGLLIAEVIVDFAWGVIYYHKGAYLNYGVGAVYGLLLWIPVLVITGTVVTIRNKKVA